MNKGRYIVIFAISDCSAERAQQITSYHNNHFSKYGLQIKVRKTLALCTRSNNWKCKFSSTMFLTLHK